MIAGGMDFSHQSFDDIVKEMKDRLTEIGVGINYIVDSRQILIDNGYWGNVDYDFRALVNYSQKFYETCTKEISEILIDFQTEIKQHHVTRVDKLYDKARELNIDFGRVWNRTEGWKEYGNENFMLVEKIYIEARQVSINMLDLGPAAHRLQDFVGRQMQKPWPHDSSVKPMRIGEGILDQALFHKFLSDYFSFDDVKTLCFKLGVDFDELEGQAKQGKIRELIILANRRDILASLFELVLRENPNVSWHKCIVPMD